MNSIPPFYTKPKNAALENFLVSALIRDADPAYEAYRQIGSMHFFPGIIYQWISRCYQEIPEELTEINDLY